MPRRLLTRLTLLLALLPGSAALACQELHGAYGLKLQGKGFGEYFLIRRFEDSYVVYANEDGKWALTPNSFLYVLVRDPAWIERVKPGAIPVCAIEMLGGSLFGVYRMKPGGPLMYATLVGSSGQVFPLTRTRDAP